MKRGIDTNVLVYAHVAALPEHGVVREYLAGSSPGATSPSS